MTRPALILVESDATLREAVEAVAQACSHTFLHFWSLSQLIAAEPPRPGDTLMVDLTEWADIAILLDWRAGLPSAPRTLVLTEHAPGGLMRRTGPVEGVEVWRMPIEAARLVALLDASP
jgi:hypothetical protein